MMNLIRMPRLPALFLACTLMAGLAPPPWPSQAELSAEPHRSQDAPSRPTLAPYVPTPQDVVERMLRLAAVRKSDVVYDLGSGDGRLVITAAKAYGARGVGIDIDPERIAESRANAKRVGVEALVEFRQQDALQTDVSEATVVTLYLLSSANLKLRPNPDAPAQTGLTDRVPSVRHGRLGANRD